MIEIITQEPLLAALAAMVGLAVLFGSILGFAAVRFRVEGNPLVDQIDAILPQTQCGQCGHPGCRPYAEAIADGEESDVKTVAYIHEDLCIGCTKCIQACPVDAILGAPKQMHTVIVDECTGCDLCVEPCPVDCIDMVPVPRTLADWRWELPPVPGERFDRGPAEIIATDRGAEGDRAA